MSASVSFWQVLADKPRKDSFCLHDDVDSAPLSASFISLYLPVYMSTNLAPELHSLVSFKRNIFQTNLLLFDLHRWLPCPGSPAQTSTLICF